MAGVGWVLWSTGPRLKVKEGTDLIIRPRSPLTLIFIIIAFATKFTLVVFRKVDPILKDALNFNLVFGLLTGIICGVFWGGMLNLSLTSKFSKCPEESIILQERSLVYAI